MTDKIRCDYASVGIIARDSEDRILLVERMKFPFGWAPPSGHCDGLSYGTAAFKEFEEETGLKIIGGLNPLIPKNPIKYFKCRRGGEYHDWQIFEVNWKGELKPSRDETKNAKWHTVEEICELAEKTGCYLQRMQESIKAEEQSWVAGIQESIEKEWQANPGLEPVWYEFFQELKII